MLDARRMEVYSAVFDANNVLKEAVSATIISETSFSHLLNEKKVYFYGDGADKCKNSIVHKNAHFIANKFPSAEEMAALSFEKYNQKDTEDVAYFEPFYLKDFIVTPPKK
jgi:tRNA threonylcarbamoyladenosine biosynthesis protein TsaB